MNKSSKISYKHDSVGRILKLVKLYSSQKEFLEKCDISNHSYVSDLKLGKIGKPSPKYLEKIIQGTGCNGTWLLTGSGKMFSDDPSYAMAQEPGEQYQAFDRALKLIGRIEQTSDAVKEIELPPGIELQLAELLVKLLKRREGN